MKNHVPFAADVRRALVNSLISAEHTVRDVPFIEDALNGSLQI